MFRELFTESLMDDNSRWAFGIKKATDSKVTDIDEKNHTFKYLDKTYKVKYPKAFKNILKNYANNPKSIASEIAKNLMEKQVEEI